jgi:branched-chain amino acid transport system permease protein
VTVIDTILQGLLLGGLYALFATGLSLIFGVMRIVNLAHGDLSILAAFLAVVVVETLGLNPFVALVLVAPLMAALGYGLQTLILNRLLGRGILPPILVTFGLSIIIQNALLETFSADSRRLNPGGIDTASLALGPQLAIASRWAARSGPPPTTRRRPS